MNYKQLLKAVADFGHGVFTITMLEDPKERLNFKLWIYRNRSKGLIKEFLGKPGSVKICYLTKNGMIYFKSNGKISSAKNYYSYLDMALINAFMIETNNFNNYTGRPHEIITIGSQRVGIISMRHGIPKNVDDIDILITLRAAKEKWLNAKLEQIPKHNDLEILKTKTLIKNSSTPKAFLNFRY